LRPPGQPSGFVCCPAVVAPRSTDRGTRGRGDAVTTPVTAYVANSNFTTVTPTNAATNIARPTMNVGRNPMWDCHHS